MPELQEKGWCQKRGAKRSEGQMEWRSEWRKWKVVKGKTSCNREVGAPVQVHPQGGKAKQTCLTACREMVCRASHMRTGSSGPSEANGTNKIGQSSSLSSIVSRFCIANLALFFLQKSVVSDRSQRAVLRLFEMYLQFRRRTHLCWSHLNPLKGAMLAVTMRSASASSNTSLTSEQSGRIVWLAKHMTNEAQLSWTQCCTKRTQFCTSLWHVAEAMLHHEKKCRSSPVGTSLKAEMKKK